MLLYLKKTTALTHFGMFLRKKVIKKLRPVRSYLISGVPVQAACTM